MRKPFPEFNEEIGVSTDLVLVHHTIEAISDATKNALRHFKELEGVNLDKVIEYPDLAMEEYDLSAEAVGVVYAYKAMESFHEIIHDYIAVEGRQATMHDIKSQEGKEIVTEHVPYVVADKKHMVPLEYKAAVNKVLRRK